jgi:hypothetical protein
VTVASTMVIGMLRILLSKSNIDIHRVGIKVRAKDGSQPRNFLACRGVRGRSPFSVG